MHGTIALVGSVTVAAVMALWSPPTVFGQPAQPSQSTDWSFLRGHWCYLGIQMSQDDPGVAEKELYNYVFNADGTLRFSDKKNRDPKKNGSWTVTGDRIRILPMFGSFDLRLASFGKDNVGRPLMKLTSPLTGPAEMHWVAFPCSCCEKD
jgi:hypothetical protein